MARKKRKKAHRTNPRRRAKKRNPATRKRSHRRRTNPATTHRRKRAHRRNPSRRRRARRNPSQFTKKRKGHRRGRRRNPTSPYVAAGGSILLALVVGTIEGFAPGMIAPKDPVLAGRIRMGLGVVGTIGGIALAKKHPMLGLAIAAPSFSFLVGGYISEALTKALAPSTTSAHPQTQSGLVRTLGALVAQSRAPLSGLQPAHAAPQLSAVYGQDMSAVYAENMGAVYSENMGDVAGGAPWAQATPFG